MNLDNIFTYHAPTAEQVVAMGDIRHLAKCLALAIQQHVPAGADQSAAIRKVREAVMTANAGIVLNGQL